MKRAVLFGVLLGMLVGCGEYDATEVQSGAATSVPQCDLPTTEDAVPYNVGYNYCTDRAGNTVMQTLADGRKIPRAECVTLAPPKTTRASDCEWKNTNTQPFNVWCAPCQ